MKLLLVGLLAGCLGSAHAQTQQQRDMDWYNCSFEEDGVYGAAVNKAYQFLQGKEVKKTPVIAFIGTGMDVYHEDLCESIWENPNPTRGDINGWNFIGGRDGEMLVEVPSLANREYERLEGKYGDLLYSDGKYWHIVNDRPVEYTGEVDEEEFKYYEMWRQTGLSELMNTRYSTILMYFMRNWMERANREMRAANPGKELGQEDYIRWGASVERNHMDSMCFFFTSMTYGTWENMLNKKVVWDSIYNFYTDGRYFASCREKFERAKKSVDLDIRKRIVGDDVTDINDTDYGNDNLFSTACLSEVMRASIAVGKRGNGIGADGIADFTKLMSLCAYPERGEPYGKDIALAIRYAVEHGADIITLAYQYLIASPQDTQWLKEALEYAESKNVLVIISAWERADDTDLEPTYCPGHVMDGHEFTNLMIVSPSDKNGKPSLASNYGANTVDIFAPGMEIYAASTGDTYQKASGTALAAGTVAGVAALVKGYYPELTAAQLRNLLIETATPRKGVIIEKTARANGQRVTDLFLFDELCRAKGIVNAYNAVVAADKMTK